MKTLVSNSPSTPLHHPEEESYIKKPLTCKEMKLKTQFF